MKTFQSFLLLLLFTCSTNVLFAQLEWIPFQGEVPGNVVIGGTETNRSLPVCRCEYKGAKHPGKVVANKCNIGYGGLEKTVSNFEILINKGGVHLDWEKTNGPLPDNAIIAGNERGLNLYVGRAHHNKGTHPGKVFKVGSNYICNIGYGGKELTMKTFEVLVEHKTSTVKHQKHDRRCVSADSTSAYTVGYIGSMYKDSKMTENFILVSGNLKYGARVTDDGRLVVEEILEHAFCDDGKILIFKTKEIWANTTNGQDPALDYYLTLQKDDGNFCIYSEQKGFFWCAMCHNQDGHHLELTNIGHIEVVNSHGGEIWPD